MCNRLLILALFLPTLVFSQKEASVWYFGQNAGLKFNDNGTVSTISGQLFTEEGCSSIADVNGNLLFYTDGRTVWDKNHIQMPNGAYALGTGLFGDGSSTQSGIIVPKPGNPNIYYIFTVDEPHSENAAVYPNAFSGTYGDTASGSTPADDDGRNNGFNYSVVDLSVAGNNGSHGDVVSRNNHLVTYDPDTNGEQVKYKCAEKITAVRNESNNSFWVITQFVDRFYAFKVDANGVNSSPVISVEGSNQILAGYRRNAIGYLKASPDGSKLAIAHQQNGNQAGQASFVTGSIQLFDFDINTGIVSNATTLVSGVMAYGVEFSSSSKKLYGTIRNGAVQEMQLVQFDLEAPDMPASKQIISNGLYYFYGLQLAPNNKIYCATAYQHSLGVINDPEATGIACDFTLSGQPLLANTQVKLGLPPFITSFFYVDIQAQNKCLGDVTSFSLNNNQPVISADWNFGDTFTSTDINPQHQYLNSGTYTVTVTATTANGTSTKSRDIIISAVPLAYPVTAISVCGDSPMTFNPFQLSPTIRGSQSAVTYETAYFGSQQELEAHANPLSVGYEIHSGLNTIYGKVYNHNNPDCYAFTTIAINLYIAPIANTTTDYFECDDSTNDGKGIFNLQPKIEEILGNQDSAEFTVSFHLKQADADSDQNPLSLNYPNFSNPQLLFARIENNLNDSCYATTSFGIGLYKLPVALQPQDFYMCDDESNNGLESFDLSLRNGSILGVQSDPEFSVSYYVSNEDALIANNPLPNDYPNTSNGQQIFARLSNILHPECFDIKSFRLYVSEKPEIDLEESYSICEGTPITITAPAGFSSYLWSNGTQGRIVNINEAGNYSLTVTKSSPQNSCQATKDITVYNSNIAEITKITSSDWTDNQNSISVQVTGDGDYEYSLDDINYQGIPDFTGLSSGDYTVYVRDKKGCGTATEDVFLLMYPKFFTPNGDGVNDNWKIKFSIIEPDMQLYIFDRYGKLITGFDGQQSGWDGTLNGNPLPADDYWFVITRENGKEFKGHFSLKR